MDIAQLQFTATPSAQQLAPLAAIKPHMLIVFGSVARLTDAALPASQARAGAPALEFFQHLLHLCLRPSTKVFSH